MTTQTTADRTVQLSEEIGNLGLSSEQYQQLFADQLQQMAREAEQTAPQRLHVGQVLKGDYYGFPIESVVTELSDAGFVLLHEARTGMPSPIAKNLFSATIGQKFEDGTPMYVLAPPKDAEGNLLILSLIHI